MDQVMEAQITPNQALEELERHEFVKELYLLGDAIMAVGVPSIGPDGWEMPVTKTFEIRDGLVDGRAVMEWLGY
jgi:hypothetical protein